MKVAISFQPDILAMMSQFSIFGATLKKHMATATEKSGPVIVDSIRSHQHWQSGDGTLEDSFVTEMVDEMSAYIGSPLPYAWRLEDGFNGPDSLGRVYSQDGAFYIEAALDDETMLFEVGNNYIDAVYAAWNELVGGVPSGTSAVMGLL